MKLSELRSKHLSGDDRKPIMARLTRNGWERASEISDDAASQRPSWKHPSRPNELFTLLNAARINERMK